MINNKLMYSSKENDRGDNQNERRAFSITSQNDRRAVNQDLRVDHIKCEIVRLYKTASFGTDVAVPVDSFRSTVILCLECSC